MNTSSAIKFSRRHKSQHRTRDDKRSRYKRRFNRRSRRSQRTVRRSRGYRRQHQHHQHQHQHHQHQHQHQHHQRVRQSGGDLLNYLPSDLSMVARSAAHSISGAWSGVKGVVGSDNPLPYNDHHLQKSSVSVSDHLPDLKRYYENANALIPAI